MVENPTAKKPPKKQASKMETALDLVRTAWVFAQHGAKNHRGGVLCRRRSLNPNDLAQVMYLVLDFQWQCHVANAAQKQKRARSDLDKRMTQELQQQQVMENEEEMTVFQARLQLLVQQERLDAQAALWARDHEEIPQILAKHQDPWPLWRDLMGHVEGLRKDIWRDHQALTQRRNEAMRVEQAFQATLEPVRQATNHLMQRTREILHELDAIGEQVLHVGEELARIGDQIRHVRDKLAQLELQASRPAEWQLDLHKAKARLGRKNDKLLAQNTALDVQNKALGRKNAQLAEESQRNSRRYATLMETARRQEQERNAALERLGFGALCRDLYG